MGLTFLTRVGSLMLPPTLSGAISPTTPPTLAPGMPPSFDRGRFVLAHAAAPPAAKQIASTRSRAGTTGLAQGRVTIRASVPWTVLRVARSHQTPKVPRGQG